MKYQYWKPNNESFTANLLNTARPVKNLHIIGRNLVNFEWNFFCFSRLWGFSTSPSANRALLNRNPCKGCVTKRVLHLLAKRVYCRMNICRIKWICQLAPILARNTRRNRKKNSKHVSAYEKPYPVSRVTLTSAESEGWTRNTVVVENQNLFDSRSSRRMLSETIHNSTDLQAGTESSDAKPVCMEPLTLCLLRCIMGSLIPFSCTAQADWFKLQAANKRRRKNCLLCKRAHACN